jgi:hypothetical protein
MPPPSIPETVTRALVAAARDSAFVVVVIEGWAWAWDVRRNRVFRGPEYVGSIVRGEDW